MKQPKFSKNEKVEFMLRNDSARSGFTHHCGYIKRAVRKGLFSKHWVYYICQASREERYIWKVRENDILGIVEYKQPKDDALTMEKQNNHKDKLIKF